MRNPKLLREPTEGVRVGVIEEITERLIQLATHIAVVTIEPEVALRRVLYVLDRGKVVRSWCGTLRCGSFAWSAAGIWDHRCR